MIFLIFRIVTVQRPTFSTKPRFKVTPVGIVGWIGKSSTNPVMAFLITISHIFSCTSDKRMKFELYEKSFSNSPIISPADSAISNNAIKIDSNVTERGLLILPAVVCPSTVAWNSRLWKVMIHPINELLRKRLHINSGETLLAWQILDFRKNRKIFFFDE